MYTEKMIEIGRVENGFIVECRIPLKEGKEEESANVVSEYPGSTEKKFIAQDEKKLMALLKKLVPMLDMGYVDEFESAFNKAAK